MVDFNICGYKDAADVGEEKYPKSFSRFILPFRYSQQGPLTGSPTSDYVYEEMYGDIRDVPADRRSYLVKETADILFRRAKWFKLKKRSANEEWAETQCLTIPGRDRKVEVVLSAPSLVLFEWEAKSDYDSLKTGFLILEIQFKEGTALKDMMFVNEHYRYTSRPYRGHGVEMAKMFGKQVKMGKEVLPDISCETCKEIYFDRWQKWLDCPVEVKGGGERRLFDAKWTKGAERYLEDSFLPEGEKAPPRAPGETGEAKSWIVHDDNRAFTWTCAVMDGGGGKLRDHFGKLPAWELGHWIQLLNVDPPSGDDDTTIGGCTDFQKRWAEKRTYKRWQEWGTFYGYTSHSGAALVPPFNVPPMWKHMRDMYFDQALLLLYLRTSILRLSNELNAISAKAIASGDGSVYFRKPFAKLREAFLHITNMYQYPMLSNQQQSLEMYEIFREELDIKTLFPEVKEKIESGHEYIENNAAINLDERVAVITYIGGGIAVTATVAQLLSLSSEGHLFGFFYRDAFVSAASGVLFMIILGVWSYRKWLYRAIYKWRRC